MSDIKSQVKQAAKNLLVNSGMLQFAGRFAKSTITVLRYHSINEDPKQQDDFIDSDIVHPLSLFTKQMEAVARRFNPVSLDDILLSLEGKAPFPKNAIVVTFDDGFADNFEVASPVLQRFSIPATFYITVNSIITRDLPWFCRIRYSFSKTQISSWFDSHAGIYRRMASNEEKRIVFRLVANRCAALSGSKQENYVKSVETDFEIESLPAHELMLNWQQIKSLHNAGHIIGSHTMTHPNVAHIGADEQQWELGTSKQIIENELGINCNHFSYPHPTLHPHWTDQTVEMTEKTGYKTATTTTFGVVKKGDNPLEIKRVVVPKEIAAFLFLLETIALR